MQSKVIRRRARSRPAIVPALLAIASACSGVSGVVPPGLDGEVAAARQSLESHWDNGPLPPTFTFVAVRCRADGGLLVLFDQRGFGSDGLAIAMQGPDALPEHRSGGFAPVDPATDPEIAHFFNEAPEVPCRRP